MYPSVFAFGFVLGAVGTAPHVGISPCTIGDEYIKFSFSHSDLGVIMDCTLKFHNHIRRNANICNGLTTNLFISTLSREADFLMNIYRAHIRPQIEYCSCLWNAG